MPALHIITCPDDYLLSAAAKDALAALVSAENREYGIETIDGMCDTIGAASEALDKARAALSQTGFFATEITVWLKNATFFDAKRLANSTTFADKLADFAAWLAKPGIPDGSHLVISSPSIPKNTKFYKAAAALQKTGAAQLTEVEPPTPKTAAAHLRQLAKERGATLTSAVADEIVARVGSAPRMLAQELDKLLAYTNGAPPDSEAVEAVCAATATGEFWDLTDAFGARDLRRSIKVMTSLLDSKKAEPVLLVTQVESRLNELHLVSGSISDGLMDTAGRWTRSLTEEDADAIARLGKFDPSAKNPWVASKIASQAAKWRPADLRRARRTMNTAHERMVTISGVDSALILQMAIIEALS